MTAHVSISGDKHCLSASIIRTTGAPNGFIDIILVVRIKPLLIPDVPEYIVLGLTAGHSHGFPLGSTGSASFPCYNSWRNHAHL